MEGIPSKLQYKTNSLVYYKNIFPWLNDKQIKKYFKPEGNSENTCYGILLTHNYDYYFLTPLLLKAIDPIYLGESNIECDLLFHSSQLNLSLFKLKSKPLENAIEINNLKKIIPKENDKLMIKSKEYGFKKEFKPLIGKANIDNLYYIVDDIDIGLPVYYNNHLVGISIHNDLIINIISIINFLNEIIKYGTYNGICTLYYDYKTIENDTKIIDNYNIIYSTNQKNNLYINDILLEIDDYKIIDNNIDHLILGKVSVFTYISLYHNNDTTIKLKIFRNNIIEKINIIPKSIYKNEIISTNCNEHTLYKKKNGNVHYVLNNNIITEMIKIGGNFAIEKQLKHILNYWNVSDNEKFVMLFKLDDLKNCKLSLINKMAGKNTIDDL